MMRPRVFELAIASPRKAFGLALLVLFAGSNQFCSSPGTAGPPQLKTIQLPPGFSIDIYASSVPGARSMTLSDSGVLFVGSRGAGKVYAVVDSTGDHVANEVIVIDSGLNSPNGVALRDGALYVAEINRILRYDDIETTMRSSPEPEVVNDTYPAERYHGWKFIRFGPDGKLYVPVGAPCNVCDEEDDRFASITRMNPDGSGFEVFAHGVRNTVGFDWHPETGELWFTDNGRDMMGNDIPPDELNHAPRAGMHFGFPYCHGGEILDPEFGQGRSCDEFTPPARKLGAHVASLGMRFYTGNLFPEKFRHQIFIAEHGSWNRSTPIGYRVSLVRLVEGVPTYETFAEGWLQKGKAWGRPVDIEMMEDGTMLVSDDRAGAIYRIRYTE